MKTSCEDSEFFPNENYLKIINYNVKTCEINSHKLIFHWKKNLQFKSRVDLDSRVYCKNFSLEKFSMNI